MSAKGRRARFASVLFTVLATTAFASSAFAGETAPSDEVDASREPECPSGWYCARDPEPSPGVESSPAVDSSGVALPTSAVTAPASRYPVSTLLFRGGWLPMPEEASERAALFALGLGFQHRATRAFGFDVGPGVVFGRDYLGRERVEAVAELSAVASATSPFRPGPYVLVGPQLSIAWVEGLEERPVYLGGHLGLGISWPIGTSVGLLAELDGFAQGRIDAGQTPDYQSPLTGVSSDMALGGLLRVGLSVDLTDLTRSSAE
jgi:hypothetical protein